MFSWHETCLIEAKVTGSFTTTGEDNAMKGRHLLLAGALLALPTLGMAVPIEGEIGISGVLVPTCSGGQSPCDFDDADGLDFGNNGAGAGAFLVTLASGDFAADGLGFGDIGSINDFMYDPLSPAPVDPLWTVMGDTTLFSFTLETVTINQALGNFLDLSGTGTLSAAGFDDTMGNWTLSTDSASGALFSWSSTTATPEPGALVLFGLGLFGLLGLRRK